MTVDKEAMRKAYKEIEEKELPPEMQEADRLLAVAHKIFEQETLLLDAATEVCRKAQTLIDLYDLSKTRWPVREFASGSDAFAHWTKVLAEVITTINSKYTTFVDDSTVKKAKAILASKPPALPKMTEAQYKNCYERAQKFCIPWDDRQFLEALAKNHLVLSPHRPDLYPFCIIAPTASDPAVYCDRMYVVPNPAEYAYA